MAGSHNLQFFLPPEQNFPLSLYTRKSKQSATELSAKILCVMLAVIEFIARKLVADGTPVIEVRVDD